MGWGDVFGFIIVQSVYILFDSATRDECKNTDMPVSFFFLTRFCNTLKIVMTNFINFQLKNTPAMLCISQKLPKIIWRQIKYNFFFGTLLMFHNVESFIMLVNIDMTNGFWNMECTLTLKIVILFGSHYISLILDCAKNHCLSHFCFCTPCMFSFFIWLFGTENQWYESAFCFCDSCEFNKNWWKILLLNHLQCHHSGNAFMNEIVFG